MTSIARTFLRWFALLVVISVAMGFLQWLAAPEGYGANGWAHALLQIGFPRTGNVLLWLSDKAEAVKGIDHFWQHVINAPRNQLLHAFRAIEVVDFYTISDRVGYWPNVRDAFVLIVGTIGIYLPLTLGIAVIRRSGWRSMKEPVLIASLLYVIFATGFLSVSSWDEESKLAMVFLALSLLTAAVGILWSPAISRRDRFIGVGALLIACSIIGMLSVTLGRGPRDPLSYPTFFGWSLVMLLLEGAPFLLLVWIALKAMERLRGNASPPSMELKTAK